LELYPYVFQEINKMKIDSRFLIGIWFSIIWAQSCTSPVKNYSHKIVFEDTLTIAQRTIEIRKNLTIEIANGLKLSLWASDSLAPDPIAMSIDDYGHIYLTRTNRQKNSEFDIRGYRDWMIASISLQSVEDRRAFLRETFATERSKENSWLEDLNKDGIHDWHDLTVEKEEVWRLEDLNNNGIADISTRILEDFNEEITDVAGALLVRRNDLFVGIGPDMWRITDTNGDGMLDTKVSISHGYAVHIGFGAHGMSGVIEGPDGKIYWGIGDIGANITSVDGKTFKYPNQGVLVRSNPDGSDFEVFAAGLRNMHEFVFDEYGNIIGSDNDGDHPGESERLIYIVEGSDAGWRSNWQYGKYTDPKNNAYKVWMDEKLYLPRWDGQAAYITPPIQNFHNGPAGMTYNPGTALGERWKNKFFLVEFTGTPSRSPIWAFSLKPSGASFKLDKEEKVLQGILPTGIRFGPDGALYAADWITGWGTKNYGRVWKIDVTNEANDMKAERSKTLELMQLDYSDQLEETLYELLFYEDMRIRQKAQFELARRGRESKEIFEDAVNQKINQLARIHGIWGIGQLVRLENVSAAPLLDWLEDNDPEIVAQAAKVIGEVRFTEAGDLLIPLLRSENYRVKFFSAQALGRIKYHPAVQPLLQMLDKNADEDVYIRQAGVLALSRIGDVNSVLQLKDNSSKSLRLAAVLVLRQLGDESIKEFLNDDDEYIVTEAARAINDDWSIESALPDLAALLQDKKFTSEPLLRRSINAASRVGGESEIDHLIDFTGRMDVNSEVRAEALAVLGTWESPSVLDRVDGRFRGEVSRDASYVVSKLRPFIGQYLGSNDDEIVLATITAITTLGINDFEEQQLELARSHTNPEIRAAIISSLNNLKYQEIDMLVQMGLNDKDEIVRTTAVGLISELDITRNNLSGMVTPIFEIGSLQEQQQMLRVLGQMSSEITEEVLGSLASQWMAGKLDPGLSLEIIEAIDSSKSDRLIAMIESRRSSGNKLADYTDALYGGNGRQGSRIFWSNPTAQCVRCHTWNDEPGSVGPAIRGIGSKLSREEILQSLIEPGARLSPGFGSVTVTLSDGSSVSGILLEENKTQLLLRTSDAEPLKIPIQRIASRVNAPSSMPSMGPVLTRKEIRDLVEFLSTLKE